MTIIQTDRTGAKLNLIFITLMAAVVVAAVTLVFLYNRLMNLKHEAAAARQEIEVTELRTAEMQEKLFALLNKDSVAELATNRALVQERNPKYLQISPE